MEKPAGNQRSGGAWVWAGSAAFSLGVLGVLLMNAPRKEGALDWFAPMIPGGWMAWTLPVALFFWTIGSTLVVMTVLAIRHPETPRLGILRIETTRGDRLFISLLGSAFICLLWLFFAGSPLWGGLGLGLVYSLAVFRWV